MAPTIEMPRVTILHGGGGPIIPGTLFPFLFITIACGAVSGFHSLVSSGTTPKMIEQESQATVGYGAMLLESFVGVMALIAASVLIPGDYLAINTISRLKHLLRWAFLPRTLRNYPGSSKSMWRAGPAGPCHSRLAWRPFFQRCLVWRAHGLLVSVCAGVRSAVYFDDDRYRNARGALSVQEMADGYTRHCGG